MTLKQGGLEKTSNDNYSARVVIVEVTLIFSVTLVRFFLLAYEVK
jgi:hypothetical protein